mgnify:FL=1
MNPVADDVLALEARRRDAMRTGDTQALGALLAPTLRYLHSTGAVDTRDSLLAKLARSEIAYERLDLAPRLLAHTPDTAVVEGEMQAEVLRGGLRREIATRYLAVWLREGDAWQLVACQGTALPPV